MTKLALEYKDFLLEIKSRIQEAQYKALSSVNKSLLILYSGIGKMISDKQDRWKSVIENISIDLKRDFPGIKGFTADNIRRMVKFYEAYKDNEKLGTLSLEISWSNNLLILEKCKDDLQRQFYMLITKKEWWSARVLDNMITGEYYERFMIAHKDNNLDQTLVAQQAEDTKLALKDSYLFDFLSLGKKYKEKDLHDWLLLRIQEFLLELWMWFAFIGSQYEIKVEGDSYFIDLLFFHVELNCYIVVELKVVDFKPEFVGKLNFYVNVVDEVVKRPEHNPTIWLLICKNKKEHIVRYALKDINKPIAVSKYEESKHLWDKAKKLPTQEQIEEVLLKYEQGL